MDEQARRTPSPGTQQAGAASLGRRWAPAGAGARELARLAGRPARVQLLDASRAAAWASRARSSFVWSWELCNRVGTR